MEALTEEQLEHIRGRLIGELKKIRLESYRPYPKQAIFHARGGKFREVAFLAANQSGKTLSAAFEVAMHLTGRYPKGWVGRRFDHPIRAIAGSESAELTRKGVQRLLMGPPEIEAEWGTGSIPQRDIVDWSRRQGVPNALDSVITRWHDASGKPAGQSVLQLLSYDQGRTKWQADTVDLVWFDEEPDEDLYMEGLTRTNVGMGLVMLTATPLKGMSAVVSRFYPEPKFPGCSLVTMTIDDALHYTPEERAAIVAQYKPHEAEARARGIPVLGSGRIYPIREESISIPAFPIPDYWPRIAGVDFGSTHPAACSWLALDRDTDTVYLYDAHKEAGMTPVVHAAVLISRGKWIPVAWPHDGLNETQVGPALSKQFRQQGANMRPENAKFPEDSRHAERSRVSVEGGIAEILTRMQTGRFKVFSHLNDWFAEFRQYHRKDGKVVKEFDDLLDSTRMAIMDLRYAKTKPEPSYQRHLAGTTMLDPVIGY